MKRAGRQRGIAAACVRLQAIFRRTWLHQLPLVEQAIGQRALALLIQLNAATEAEDALARLAVAGNLWTIAVIRPIHRRSSSLQPTPASR